LEWVKSENITQKIDPIQILDFPHLQMRAFHLDLKDLMPTFEYITDFIKFIARYKTNYLCIEYEDKYHYEGYLEPMRHQYCLTEEQLDSIKDLCEAHYIEIIPLIQIFGHIEKHLRKEPFRELQETPTGKPMEIPKYKTWSLCPLHPNSEKFAIEMADQIIAGHKNSKFIHIGADEVYQLGTCPKCMEYLKTHSKSELYISHINKVAKHILQKGKIPIMWHDFLLKYPENLDLLDKNIVIMYWIYNSWRGMKLEGEKILPHFDFFHQKGFKTMGAPSISSSFAALVPDYKSRIENIAGQAQRADESGSLGLLNTSWVVCGCPLETQKIGIMIGQSMMWNPPSNWDDIDWNQLDQSIQLYLFGIKTDQIEPWLEKFVDATEIGTRKWPKKDSLHIMLTLQSIDIMINKSPRNGIIFESLKFGLRHRFLYSEIAEKLKIFHIYGNTDNEITEFPAEPTFEKLSEFFSSILDKYKQIIDDGKNFFIEDHKQILPGEFDGLFGLTQESNENYDRYIKDADYHEIVENLKKVSNDLSDLLLSIFRQDIPF
jgi:hypothetical protein